MVRMTRVQALKGHRLHVEFSDGVSGEFDLSTRLFGPMFLPLQDEGLFAQVSIDDFGAPVWPNGADLGPEFLHDNVRVTA